MTNWREEAKARCDEWVCPSEHPECAFGWDDLDKALDWIERALPYLKELFERDYFLGLSLKTTGDYVKLEQLIKEASE